MKAYHIIPPSGASFTGKTVKSIFELMAESTDGFVHFEDCPSQPVKTLQTCSIEQVKEKPVYVCPIFLG